MDRSQTLRITSNSSRDLFGKRLWFEESSYIQSIKCFLCLSFAALNLEYATDIKMVYFHFQVSQYTGRIHLYTCIPGIDLRPRPLFLNFRPEEVELLDSSVDDSEKTNFNLDAAVYKHALQEFLSEWRKLRPIEQRKLHGKPLQLPLDIELCYLKESINHNADVC